MPPWLGEFGKTCHPRAFFVLPPRQHFGGKQATHERLDRQFFPCGAVLQRRMHRLRQIANGDGWHDSMRSRS
jgi:hypothetical protein